MTKQLEPCPFCKGTDIGLVDVGALKWHRCGGCLANGPCARTEEEADSLWNASAERTCRRVVFDPSGPYGHCSECGHRIGSDDRWCSGCGAKVVV